MMPPRATVRLQFHAAFTLTDALALVDYFAGLGISHIYASPLTRARAGSTHGYDIIDPTLISPELGGEAALRQLVRELRGAGMGLILDIVPNHMAASAANPWWWDVLTWGRGSRYATYFDIDWNSPDPTLRGKLLAPFLGEPYGAALAAGHLRLHFDPRRAGFEVRYFDNPFPITPDSIEPGPHSAGAIQAILAAHNGPDAASRERLHRLLERQHYRLAWWRTAAEAINWRRFFEINELAGVRVEEPVVFEAVHALVLRLYAQGLIDGVRIDHIDGLSDPRRYCRDLRARLAALTSSRAATLRQPPYILVEKILAEEEQLESGWEVDGTTGYDFMDQLGALLHDENSAAALTQDWQAVSGSRHPFAWEAIAARRQLLERHFAGELDGLARALHRLARLDRLTRDWELAAIRRVVSALLLAFPVYRSYADRDGRHGADIVFFQQASRAAAHELPDDEHALLEQIGQWLGGEAPQAQRCVTQRAARLDAIRRFQQLTAPLMAKSVEDTAGFRYGRLLSRNEVGSNPDTFALAPEAFHRYAAERARRFPQALLATATHDHKRGEDARARLAALSELPALWRGLAGRWLAKERDAPHPVDQYMLFQTLIAAWPPGLAADDAHGVAALAQRVGAWQTKALREGKQRSSWFAPCAAYENRCQAYLDARLREPAFLDELAACVAQLAPLAALKGLAQCLLRMTLPGVPDLYQGTEFWDFSLTDPDNRRPVEYASRMAALLEPADLHTLLMHWQDGRIKQALIRRVLCYRREHPMVFARGDYRPLALEGAGARHALAFARHHGGDTVVVVVPRLCPGLADAPGSPAGALPRIPADWWGDTTLVLPEAMSTAPLRNLFDGTPLAVATRRPALGQILSSFPLALFGAPAPQGELHGNR